MYCNKTPLFPVVFLDIGCLCVFDAERKWGVHPSSPAVRVPSSRERPKTTDRQDLEMSVPGAAWDRGTGVGAARELRFPLLGQPEDVLRVSKRSYTP